MLRLYCVFLGACVMTAGCAPYVRLDRAARYSAGVLYADRSFTDEAFSGRSLLLLPILTAQGPSASFPLSAQRLGMELQKTRTDLRLQYASEFEKKYLSTHTIPSLSDFYRRLYRCEVLAVETSDSVWKAIDAAYLLVVKLKYAAAIRGFDGNTRKQLCLEAEIWDVNGSEAVWRVEVKGIDNGMGLSDDQFIMGAFSNIFAKMPGVGRTNSESDW